MYDPLVLSAIQHWQKTGHSLHLALDTTVLVALSVSERSHCSPVFVPSPFWRIAVTPALNGSAGSAAAMLKRDELTFSQSCEGTHRIMEETKSKVAAGDN
jgi:hypothetical protein